jgi:predicted esterase
VTDVRSHTLPATTLGRYLAVLPEREGPAPLLAGFHGYGESAEVHLAQLCRIPGTTGWLKVSVQALHRFYNPKTQEVIGSWMTRLDREQAILDNVSYVRAVLAAVRRDYPFAGDLALAGFSQGVGMAWRIATSGEVCRGLVALAGDVPPDVAGGTGANLPRALIGRGLMDTWYTAEKLDADLQALRPRSPSVETCVFDGGHEWTGAFRQAAGHFLARIKSGAD